MAEGSRETTGNARDPAPARPAHDRLFLGATVVTAAAVLLWWILRFHLQEATGDRVFFQLFWGSYNALLGFTPVGPYPAPAGDPWFWYLNFPVASLMHRLPSWFLAVPAQAVLASRILEATACCAGAVVFQRWAARRVPPAAAWLFAAALLLNPYHLVLLDRYGVGLGSLAAAALLDLHDRRHYRGMLAAALALCGTHTAALLLVGAYGIWGMSRDGDEGPWRRRLLAVAAGWFAWLAVTNTAFAILGRGAWELWQHPASVAQWLPWTPEGWRLDEVARQALGFLRDLGWLAATFAALPLFAGRPLLWFAPSLGYMALRDGVWRGSLHSDLAVLAALSVLGARRLARGVGRPGVAVLLAALPLVASLPVADAIPGSPVDPESDAGAFAALPYVAVLPNPTLDAVRAQVQASPDGARVLAQFDLAPLFLAPGRTVGIFGLDPLDGGWDRVVLRPGGWRPRMSVQRFDADARCRRLGVGDPSSDCPLLPERDEVDLARLKADGAWRLAQDRDGIQVWERAPTGRP